MNVKHYDTYQQHFGEWFNAEGEFEYSCDDVKALLEIQRMSIKSCDAITLPYTNPQSCYIYDVRRGAFAQVLGVDIASFLHREAGIVVEHDERLYLYYTKNVAVNGSFIGLESLKGGYRQLINAFEEHIAEIKSSIVK